MYNEDLKRQFMTEMLPEDSVQIGFAAATFEACQKFEEDFGGDLCTMSLEELTPVVEQIVGLRARSALGRVIILKKYVKWCIVNGVPGAKDDIFKLDLSGLDKVRTQMVSGPEHLQQCLDEIFDDESEETVDNTHRCFYWMAFSGIDEDDIFRVRCSDVDLSKMEIYLDGRVYVIYEQAVAAFEKAVKLSTFYVKSVIYREGKKVYRMRTPGDIVVRGVSKEVNKMSMRVKLSQKNKDAISTSATKMKLSYARIRMSGLFYRMYQSELAGNEPDFGDAVDEFMSGRKYKLDSGRNKIGSKRRLLLKDYMNDYKRWKEAFQLQ